MVSLSIWLVSGYITNGTSSCSCKTSRIDFIDGYSNDIIAELLSARQLIPHCISFCIYIYICKVIYRIYSNRSCTPNSSHTWSSVKEIVAACMRDVDQVGVVTITSGTCSLIQGKTKADSLGLVLLQHGSFFDNRTSITRSEVFISQSSVLPFLWRTLCGIDPKLIKAALD